MKVNEYDDEIPVGNDETRKVRISKEIDKSNKYTSEYSASKTVKDFSNSDFLKTKKYKEKSEFDNEKLSSSDDDLIMKNTLLDHLVKNNNTVTTRLQDNIF